MKTLCGMAVVGLVLLGPMAPGAGEDGTTRCVVLIRLLLLETSRGVEGSP